MSGKKNADRFFPDREAVIKWVDQPNIVPFLENVPEDKKDYLERL